MATLPLFPAVTECPLSTHFGRKRPIADIPDIREVRTMNRALTATGMLLLGIVAVPLAAVAALLGVFGLKEKRTATEVATYLRNFVNGGGGEWDWDDFISVPIANAELEDIRRRAAAIELPPTDEGVATLRKLLEEVER
jgi:hypothetical protein